MSRSDVLMTAISGILLVVFSTCFKPLYKYVSV
jgi:hypothetical protein